jgi:hypothetical protein
MGSRTIPQRAQDRQRGAERSQPCAGPDVELLHEMQRHDNEQSRVEENQRMSELK